MALRLRLGMLGLVLLASLPAGTALAAAPTWQRPVEIGTDALTPRVALAGNGEALAVWEGDRESEFTAQGAWRGTDGTWSAPTSFGTHAIEPAVVAAADGSAVAIWSGPQGIEAADRAAGGGWSKPRLLARERLAMGQEVALDAAGDAFAVWRTEPFSGRGSSTIVAVERPAGGKWSKPVRISRGGGDAYSPQLAVTPVGDVVAVWRRSSHGERSIVQAATRLRRGKWSAPVDLSAKGENAVAPQVAIDPAGEAVAVWQRFDGAHQVIQSAARRVGKWSPPVDLSRSGRNAEEPQVTLDAAGEAVAVWSRFDGRDELIEAATRPAGRKWSRPARLSKPGRSAHGASLATNMAGASVVAWERSAANGAAIEAATRPARGAWSRPAAVSAGAIGVEPDVAIGPSGEAAAVWTTDGLVIASAVTP